MQIIIFFVLIALCCIGLFTWALQGYIAIPLILFGMIVSLLTIALDEKDLI